MRIFMIVCAAAFAMAATSVGEISSAEAAGHVTKGKPGKCGTGKFFSKAEKGCIAK
jgi:hypothetical protein